MNGDISATNAASNGNIINNSGYLSFPDFDPGGTDQVINNSGTVDMTGSFLRTVAEMRPLII